MKAMARPVDWKKGILVTAVNLGWTNAPVVPLFPFQWAKAGDGLRLPACVVGQKLGSTRGLDNAILPCVPCHHIVTFTRDKRIVAACPS